MWFAIAILSACVLVFTLPRGAHAAAECTQEEYDVLLQKLDEIEPELLADADNDSLVQETLDHIMFSPDLGGHCPILTRSLKSSPEKFRKTLDRLIGYKLKLGVELTSGNIEMFQAFEMDEDENGKASSPGQQQTGVGSSSYLSFPLKDPLCMSYRVGFTSDAESCACMHACMPDLHLLYPPVETAALFAVIS